ncbi:hypothetical protein D770_08910 [Flammeovirgaceae bacterium 311]|nr:hypothetical protein D770_04300 [Flammeovirgaceae bacterium 311]AHM60043.1 hypothetical protein D770_08910 [Flammeovirgaceae bacterium 311]
MKSVATLGDIAEVFSLFHDGSIVGWTGDNDILTLKIDCLYLAERLNADYEYFNLILYKIYRLEFDPWTDPSENNKHFKNSLGEIFEAELEILYADVKDSSVEISFNQADPKYNYCGGNLYLACEAIKIFDQEMNEIKIDELKSICNNYWEDWKIKNK